MRLIPARAGNIPRNTNSDVHVTAHPRSRGEHWIRETVTKEHQGSSPLARGTSCLILAVLIFARLIPARAGNMKTVQRNDGGGSAHPGSRGEHQVAAAFIKSGTGSSPLARGT